MQANLVEKKVIDDPNNPGKSVILIPAAVEHDNIFVLVSGLSKSASVTYFSTSLKVTIIENYGQIKVTDINEKALSKVKILDSLRLMYNILLTNLIILSHIL